MNTRSDWSLAKEENKGGGTQIVKVSDSAVYIRGGGNFLSELASGFLSKAFIQGALRQVYPGNHPAAGEEEAPYVGRGKKFS